MPHEFAERARYEIRQYEIENRKPRRPGPRFTPVYQKALPGVAAYVLVVSIVAWLAGEAVFNRDWYAAGRVDGVLIRSGEWWRTLTALTLHGSLRHLAGNIGFGILFGLLAGRLTGSGVAWLAIVVSSAVANLLNTLLLVSSHKSIGASTAVFAALGLVSGFVWRARLMSQERWPYRVGPIVGGIALLAYTGTGDANTDIGAHLAGFVCGFAAGIVLTRYHQLLPRRDVQVGAGGAALALIAAAWLAAFLA